MNDPAEAKRRHDAAAFDKLMEPESRPHIIQDIKDRKRYRESGRKLGIPDCSAATCHSCGKYEQMPYRHKVIVTLCSKCNLEHVYKADVEQQGWARFWLSKVLSHEVTDEEREGLMHDLEIKPKT